MSKQNSASAFAKLDSSQSKMPSSSKAPQKSKNDSHDTVNSYFNKVNSLFAKLQDNAPALKSVSASQPGSVKSVPSSAASAKPAPSSVSSSSRSNVKSQTAPSSRSASRPQPNPRPVQPQSQTPKSSAHTGDYRRIIADHASSAARYTDRIDSIASNVAQSSANIASVANKINALNRQIGLSRVTIPDGEAINKASQRIAIDIIKVNNQKIEALTAKNGISGMSFRINFDYDNYLKAKRAIETDVSGINHHMTASNDFNQGINTLNSHNAMITSCANQLALDVSNASSGVRQASQAAATAADNQVAASSAYRSVHSLANHLNGQVASIARSNASAANLIASQAADLSTSANVYGQQVGSIASRYVKNVSIAKAKNAVNASLQTINSNHQRIASAASSTEKQLAQINPDIDQDLTSLGMSYQNASQTVDRITQYKSSINSAVSNVASAASLAKSVADRLHAQQVALNNGAMAYEPIAKMKMPDPKHHDATYVKYYKRGYANAQQGFQQHLDQILTEQPAQKDHPNASYRIGFNNAGDFISGINDARKRILKNDQKIHSVHYNYGYDACQKLIHHSSLGNSHRVSISLDQNLLLVLGYLIGSYK